MKAKVMPTTSQGKLASWLLLSFFLLLIIVQLIVASGQEGGETIFNNLWISVPMLLTLLSGIAAFFAGLISVIKNQERSIIVFLAIIIGALIIIFIAGEFLSPD